jgi:glycosyltransferase involved in cell wall biosynthesis
LIILIVSPSFFPTTYYGGPSLSVYYLSKALAQLISPLNVVTTDANGNERLNVEKNRFVELNDGLLVKYYGNSTSYGLSLRMIFNLWKDIKSNEIIYIVSVFSPSTPEAILFSALFNKKIILSPRGQLSDWAVASRKSVFKNIWLKLFIKPYQSKIIWHATSEAEQNSIKSVFQNAKIFVIPNGINIDEYDNKTFPKNFFSKFINKPENKIIITSMGRLHKVKGFDILIESVGKLIQSGLKVYLFIAGEDNGDLNRLQDLVNNGNLRKYIFFTGHLSYKDKINFLSHSNLFALASHSENFGLVYAEALACGTPIIASKATPWQKVEEYNCGKWVPNTPEDFADAIKELSNKIDKSMKERCVKLIQENFSWDSLALKMKIQFEEILYG